MDFTDDIMDFTDDIMDFTDDIMDFTDDIMDFTDDIMDFTDNIMDFNLVMSPTNGSLLQFGVNGGLTLIEKKSPLYSISGVMHCPVANSIIRIRTDNETKSVAM
uniref:Uncharacterized protein n=1 Tax=Strigamia maritima TaxID=126957 RepID=T1JAP9_STRMM